MSKSKKNNEERTLKDIVENIRRTYFPRWDKLQQWCVKKVHGFPSFGNCDQENKTISLQPNLNNKLLEELLIHEICHAVTNGNHGKKWKDRMLKASKVAKQIGQMDLSNELKEDVERYVKTEEFAPEGFPTKSVISEAIEDMVCVNKDVSFGEVINVVAKNFGYYPEELLKDFKHCKSVYKNAKNLV